LVGLLNSDSLTADAALKKVRFQTDRPEPRGTLRRSPTPGVLQSFKEFHNSKWFRLRPNDLKLFLDDPDDDDDDDGNVFKKREVREEVKKRTEALVEGLKIQNRINGFFGSDSESESESE